MVGDNARLGVMQRRLKVRVLTEEEFDRVVQFMTVMLRSSAPESDEGLVEVYDQDIKKILDVLYGEPKWELAYSHGFDFELVSSVFYETSEFLLCKNWFKKKAHHFGHWCKKHKAPLIAAAVVVGVVAIVVATGGVGGSSATAVGGAIINDVYSKDHPQHINKPGDVYVDNWEREPNPSHYPSANPMPPPSNNLTPLEQAHALSFEKIEEAKLEIASQTHNIPESTETTYLEKAKDITKTVVSNIVHDVFESVSKIGTTWHELNPNSTPKDAQAYKVFVATQHEKIDEIFGTYHPDYSLESQEHVAAYKAAMIEEFGYFPEMQMGVLPPPGALISAASRAATIAARALGIIAKSGSAVGTAATIGSMIQLQNPVSMGQANTASQFFEKTLEHIFRDAPGHLMDTLINRELLLDAAKDPNNFMGVDKYGKSWHAKTLENGSQVWTCSQNGEIRDGGLNETPRDFHPETGLSNPIKPKQ